MKSRATGTAPVARSNRVELLQNDGHRERARAGVWEAVERAFPERWLRPLAYLVRLLQNAIAKFCCSTVLWVVSHM